MAIETEPHQAKAVGNNLRVSWKHCTEIGRWIKGDTLEKAVNKLERVKQKELAVPATKFDSDAGHVSGQGKGRYPQNAAQEVIDLLNLAKANAENEGLNAAALEVQEFITNKGPKIRTPKRHRGQSIKSAHVKIVVGER